MATSASPAPASPTRRSLAARKAATARHHPNADTDVLDRDLRAEQAADYVREIVAAAPPLSDAARMRLAALLLSVPTVPDGGAT
jgi:hypothetical protein